MNVLENARRHSGGHPVSVRARVVRTMAGEGDRLIVRVVDRGPGIPPAQLERVFEPFYSAGTARGGRRGSGLGLAIARGFLEANGGSLHVESLPGQGATFVFELPLERGGPEAAAAVSARGSEADGGCAGTGLAGRGAGRQSPGVGGGHDSAAAEIGGGWRLTPPRRSRGCWWSTTSCRSSGHCGWCCARPASR